MKHDVGKEEKKKKENIITSACSAMPSPPSFVPFSDCLSVLDCVLQGYSSSLVSLHVLPLPFSSHLVVFASLLSLCAFHTQTVFLSCAERWPETDTEGPNSEMCVYTLSMFSWVTLIMMIHNPGCLVSWSTHQARGSPRPDHIISWLEVPLINQSF